MLLPDHTVYVWSVLVNDIQRNQNSICCAGFDIRSLASASVFLHLHGRAPDLSSYRATGQSPRFLQKGNHFHNLKLIIGTESIDLCLHIGSFSHKYKFPLNHVLRFYLAAMDLSLARN